MNTKSDNHLIAAKRKLRELTRTLVGIEGFGTDGENLRIYISEPSSISSIPPQVNGFSVRVIECGQIEAHRT